MTVATRITARVLPVNARGEVMLLFGIDPLYTQHPYWFTIGGGVDEGESLADAGVRELAEETGIKISSDQLIGPFHRGRHEFAFNGVPWVSDSHFYAVALDEVSVSFDGPQAGEAGFITDWAWWQPQDLEADGRLSYPQPPAILEHAVSIVRKAVP